LAAGNPVTDHLLHLVIERNDSILASNRRIISR